MKPASKKNAGPKTVPPYPVVHALECKACGRCVEACPAHALAISPEFNERGYHYSVYAGEGCVGCALCYYTCPEPGAIEVHLPVKKKR